MNKEEEEHEKQVAIRIQVKNVLMSLRSAKLQYCIVYTMTSWRQCLPLALKSLAYTEWSIDQPVSVCVHRLRAQSRMCNLNKRNRKRFWMRSHQPHEMMIWNLVAFWTRIHIWYSLLFSVLRSSSFTSLNKKNWKNETNRSNSSGFTGITEFCRMSAFFPLLFWFPFQILNELKYMK